VRTRHLRRLPAGRGPLIKITPQPRQLFAHDALKLPLKFKQQHRATAAT